MHYEAFRPEPSLARHIHRYWFLSARGSAPSARPQLQPILPDGRMELILNLADRFRRHHRDGSVERQPAGLLAGQTTGCVVVEPSGGVDLVGVRFRPAGAAALLPVPASELRDHIIDPALVTAELARDLPDRLHAAPDVAARVRTLDRHFQHLRSVASVPDPAVSAAAALIRRSHGRMRTAAVADRLRLSERTLQRRFLAAVGIGPKLLTRIVRFQHAFRLMHETGRGGWSRVAHRCGYYDQAHLIADFRAFAGASPSRFFSGQTALVDFFADGVELDDDPSV